MSTNLRFSETLPDELLLTSLATCAGLYVLVFCRKRGIPTHQLAFEQQPILKDGRPGRVELRILLPADFAEEHVQAVQVAARDCRVIKALGEPPDVDVIAVATMPPPAQA